MQLPNDVELLCGTLTACDNHNICEPFADIVVDFLNSLSRNLMSSCPKIFSDVISFAYYCRKGNILKQKEFHSIDNLRLGKGLVFHIAPGNVPVNFAFSFVFSLLSGNLSNIIKVPSKDFEQVHIICSAINKVFESNNHFLKIKNSIAIIKYPQDSAATEILSGICDVRIIWGGDETVNKIRTFPTKSSAIDIAFFDRYSLCAIDADSIMTASEDSIVALAKSFYNDTYFIDQNACSSPHLIVWKIGNSDLNSAKKRFWDAVESLVCQNYDLKPIKAVDKLTRFFENSISLDNTSLAKNTNYCYKTQLKSLVPDLHNYYEKCGFFFEYSARNLDEIALLLSRKYQTLTYFGISKDELNNFISKAMPLGIDRIVPIGQALDIGLVWDGYNLISTLSRIVLIS